MFFPEPSLGAQTDDSVTFSLKIALFCKIKHQGTMLTHCVKE